MNDQRAGETPVGPGPPKSGANPSTGREFAGIGLQFAVTVLAFVFAGMWLDRRLGTTPWLVVALTFLGTGGGMYRMYRRAMASAQRLPPARGGGRGR